MSIPGHHMQIAIAQELRGNRNLGNIADILLFQKDGDCILVFAEEDGILF